MRAATCSAGLLALLCHLPLAHAATFILVNRDAAGSGLNEATVAAPVGGNPGKTLGEQRRIVYQFALDMYGALLESAVPIRVQASFASLGGNILGHASPISDFRDFEHAPVANTRYGSALADALRGVDNAPGEDDIFSEFTTDIDAAGAGTGWYYGLDGRTPIGQTNFLDVVTHEIGHGLGFTGDKSTARAKNYAGLVYDRFVRSPGGADWIAMSNAQRGAALTSDNLVWSGPHVTAEAPLKLAPAPALRITAPAAVAGYSQVGAADYGPPASAAAFTGTVVQATYKDASGTLQTDGCQPITNAAAVLHQIALIDRGNCNFSLKSFYAQQAGAVALIVTNSKSAPPGPMAAGDGNIARQVTIPTVLTSQAVAIGLRANLPGLSAGGVGPFPDRRLGGLVADGADPAGSPVRHTKIYAPSPVEGGSSFSHFDVSVTPSALMAPSNSSTVIAQADLDLTPALFMDIGWTVNRGNLSLLDCNTVVPISSPGGLIPGANAITNLKLCARTSASVGDYLDCTGRYVQSRLEAKLFKPAQAQSLKMCLVGSKAEAQFAAWH